MKKNKIMSFLMSVVVIAGIIPTTAFSADSAADKAEYAYFMNTWEDSAYVWLGEEIKGEGIAFIDGQAMGINDRADMYYNETVALDGLYARKQYNGNAAYFKIDKSVYEPGDTEFLFSIVYYDFGPSEGTYYLEYHTTDGTQKRVALIKPGRHPGWTVKTVVVNDADLSKTYDNGASIQIINGAYNAFKKVEIANISKAKRDGKEIKVTSLFNEILRDLEYLMIVPRDDKRFKNENLHKPCTMYDAYSLRNEITTSKVSVAQETKNYTMTQGELIDYYMRLHDLKKEPGETSVDAAMRYGIIDAMDYFISDSTPASNYNLLSIAHGTLMWEDKKGPRLLKELIDSGKYEGVEASSIKNDKFQETYYMPDEDAGPMYLPYETITDPVTKRTYNYINFFGSQMLRGYLNVNSWLPDGSGFICGTSSGFFYLYDIKSQTLTYLDQAIGNSQHLPVYMCLDGWAYYPKNEDGIHTVWRVNPRTGEKEKKFTLPKGITITYLNASNDGRYVVIEGYDNGYVLERPKDTTAIIRLDLQEQKLEYRYYAFDYSNIVDHFQVNPEYPDIVGFSHETDRKNWTYTDILDRCNIMDFTTGDVVKYNQGKLANGKAVQLVTHEIWSYDGEYRYFCSWATDTSKDSGTMPAVVRINKDGTHRQYYYAGMPIGGVNHATVSGDRRMICSDEGFLSLISTETHQIFPVANMRSVIGGKNHPYHPHPHVSYTGNLASWGHVHDGMLGIAWIDYTDILEKEVGKGGRYPFGDDVVRVSYEGVECESSVVTKDGKEAAMVKPGKALFFDINPDIVDVDDAAIKLTFDYYDNTTKPLTLTYTKGVEEYNDAWKYFNKTVSIRRDNTNKWRTAEIIIPCGNFENIGKFESDFKIASGALNAYIANVKVEKIEHK